MQVEFIIILVHNHDQLLLLSLFFALYRCKTRFIRAVVVAQLVERLLPIPGVLGSNSAIENFFIEHLFTVNCIEKTKIKKKRPGMAHFLKNTVFQLTKKRANVSIGKNDRLCLTLPSLGLWLWHSWQRGRFRYQRTRVRIQSSATFIEQLLLTVCRKDLKINEKEAENGPFLKKTLPSLQGPIHVTSNQSQNLGQSIHN